MIGYNSDSDLINLRYTSYILYNDNDRNNENDGNEIEIKEKDKFYDGKYSKSYSGENREECNICLDNDCFTYKSWVKLGCLHYFHRHCIELWTEDRETCPICRENIHNSYRKYKLNRNRSIMEYIIILFIIFTVTIFMFVFLH